ncbi:MAG: hypothetical protein KatS3mg126_0678 [Lysobacteraceae bacterium]|nr:MAG: hypothetical protein KatS3mg126_0678 [Xanthomonadaceae bacterium]
MSARLLLLGLLAGLVPVLPAAAAASASAEDADAVAKAFAAADRLHFDALPIDRLAEEDAFTDKLSGVPQRIAVGHDLAVRPDSAGSWRRDEKGRWVWELAVEAVEATHLSFGFDRFELPEGARLEILAADGSDRLGPYTAADRLAHGQLWTPVLMSDRALVRVTLPPGAKPRLELSLARVAQGYRGFGAVSKACKSGSCNTDVACLASTDPWNQPRRATGAIVIGGTGLCSGVLLNNTARDQRMLFATATHCSVNSQEAAASSVVYWRYESPTCRTPGSAESGQSQPRPSSRTSQGLRFLAATDSPFSGSGTPGSRSDWTLIELATPPAGNDFELYWAGWDRRPPEQNCAAPADPSATAGLCASIHHPAGHEKRITFVESPLTLSSIGQASGVHFRANWDPTPPLLPNIQPPPSSLPPSVTEPGSSGSPLFNAERRVVGVLSGGASACGVGPASLNDEYGGLFHAWDGLGSSTTRMRDHLDPLGTNPLALDGLDSLAAFPLALDSPAFASGAEAGDLVSVTAQPGGGTAPYVYEWDVNGDGLYERSGSEANVRFSVPAGASLTVSVRATDANGSVSVAQRSLSVRGPVLTASQAGSATQVCGDGDAEFDPGERWSIPVRLSNGGNAALAAGHALFAADPLASGGLELGPNGFGYRGTAQAGSCPYAFIDLASGAFAVPALPTRDVEGNGFGDNDDARTVDPIVLGGQGVLLYGQRYTQAVMSTNGYVSFDTAEDGGAFGNVCSGLGGTRGAQLRVLHDDLVVAAGGGLRYRHFTSCPRPAEVGGEQGCHVFQWDGMAAYTGSTPQGDASFQAVVYENTGQVVYQYRRPDPSNGASATLGLIDAAGADPFQFACNTADSVAAGRAYCAFAPGAQPETRQALRLPQAVVAVGPLAAGQAETVSVVMEVDRAAACGSGFGLDYVGSTDGLRSSFGLGGVFSGSVASSCNVVTSCPMLAAPVSQPRRGLYFNGARPGNGMNGYLYEQGDGRQFFGGLWYTADAQARPLWYLVAGEVDRQAGEVPLARVSQTAGSGFATQTQQLGRAWIGQVDADSLLLAWRFTDGSAGIERMDATQGLPFAAQNHTQAWFHPAEDGWGLAIESLDLGSSDFEFFATYVFDASGLPRWVVGDKNGTGSGTVALSAYETHCPGCPWYADAQDRPKAAGSLSIQYGASRSSATLSTSISLPAPLSGSWIRNAIPIQPIAEPQP